MCLREGSSKRKRGSVNRWIAACRPAGVQCTGKFSSTNTWSRPIVSNLIEHARHISAGSVHTEASLLWGCERRDFQKARRARSVQYLQEYLKFMVCNYKNNKNNNNKSVKLLIHISEQCSPHDRDQCARIAPILVCLDAWPHPPSKR